MTSRRVASGEDQRKGEIKVLIYICGLFACSQFTSVRAAGQPAEQAESPFIPRRPHSSVIYGLVSGPRGDRPTDRPTGHTQPLLLWRRRKRQQQSFRYPLSASESPAWQPRHGRAARQLGKPGERGLRYSERRRRGRGPRGQKLELERRKTVVCSFD